MNINPQHQQNGPNPRQPWMPTGQGTNYGYQPGQQPSQFMPSSAPMGQPNSSTGPPMMQNIPMFSSQNGNVTPPSSLNPTLSNPSAYGNAMKQQQMDKVMLDLKK